jgi:hypothetical protein
MRRILLLFAVLVSFAAKCQVIPGTTYSPRKFAASSIPNEPLQFNSHVESSSEITLSWEDNSQNETGFYIEHSTTSPSSGFTSLTTTAASAEAYSHTGLTEGSVHYYRIRATNTYGSSSWVGTSNITSIPEPTNFAAATVSASQINLTWDDNSTTETGFEISRSLTEGSEYEVIHTTAANAVSYNNTALTENTTYHYRVRALGVNNNSPYDVDDATTSPALNAPSDLIATAVSSTQIDLSWTDNSSNETAFEVYSSTNSGGTFTLIHTTALDNITSYSNTGLTAATAYYYKVRAINADGETAFTSEASATTQSGTVPIAPTTLATTSATSSAIALSWADNSSNETGFQIERSVDNTAAFSLLTTTAANATTYTDNSLDEGRRYYYRVRATNGAGNSSYTGNVNEITTWSQAITYLGKGASTASSTATLSVPLPTSPAPSNGNLMVMVVGVKTEQTIANTPTGWYNADGTGYIDYNGGSGGDQGSIRVHVYWKIAGASETGPVDVTIVNTPNSAFGTIYLFSKDSNGFWSVDFSGGSHRIPNTTSISVTSWEKFSMVKGDAMFIVSHLNTDAIACSAEAASHASATLTETTEEVNEATTAVGNDQSQVASLYHVSNNASGSNKVVYTMTGSTSTTLAPQGITAFIRLRNARTQPTYSAPVRTWRGSDIVHSTPSTLDGIGIFDGQRISAEGPAAYTTKYTIATYDGRPCLKYVADLSSGLNRRTETSEKWQPKFPIGTQIIDEFVIETDATATQALGEWIFLQIHTGTPPTGGPYPANYPLMYLAWSYVGQTGWDNTPGASPGGELIVVNNIRPDGTNYLRHRYNQIRWKPSTKYRIRYHIRADIATGDPVLKVWAAEDGDALTLLFEDYTYATVSSTDAELGSLSLCLGTPKIGVYHHMITNETTRVNSVNAGHTGVTLYIPCIKRITQLPSDGFYFTDYTNNDADIYDLVDTSDESLGTPSDYNEWNFDTTDPIDTPPASSGTTILENPSGKSLMTSQAYNGEGYTTVGTIEKDVQLDLVPRDGNLDADNFNHRLELIRADVSAGVLGTRELLGFSIQIPVGGLPTRSIPINIFQAHSGAHVSQSYDMPVFYIEISNAGRVAAGEANSLLNEIAIGNRVVEFEDFGTFNSQSRHNTGIIASAGSRLDFAISYTSAIGGAGSITVLIRKDLGSWVNVYDRIESTAWTNAADGGSEPQVHPFWKIGLYVPNCRTAADLAAQEALNGGAAGSFTVQLTLKDKIKTARLLAADPYYKTWSIINSIKP